MIEPRRKGIRSIYDAVALVAVVNVIVLTGVVGFFAANGTLNAETVRKAVQVLRGGAPEAPVSAVQAENVKGSTSSTTAHAVVSEGEMDLMQREAERLKIEIDQRVALANSIMLKVRTERETFRKEKDAAVKQQEADRSRQHDEGFQKQLQILTSLGSKTALEHILALNDPDKAAQMLVAMDTDRAKKIVESAKRGDDLTKMKLILQRMQDVAPAGGELRAQAKEEP